MHYTSEASAKSDWYGCTWITLTPGSSPECNMGPVLWGTEYTQLSPRLVKADGTKHFARSHPGNKWRHVKSKKADLSPGKDIHCKLSLQKCFWLPFAPFSDVVQTLSNFCPPGQIKFCIKITFGLCFTSAFLLPIKNHGCIGWLRKDDIPRQKFLPGFQAPAFAFRREHFDWLHFPFGHPRDPKAWEVGISERAKSPVTPVNFDLLQDHAYKRAGLPPPPATPFPIGGQGGGSRRGRRRRSSTQYHRPTQGRHRAGTAASLGNPSPKTTFGIVSPSHKQLYMLRLGLIHTLPLERECILFAGYF